MADIQVDYAAPVFYVKGVTDAGKNWLESMASLVNATVYPLCSIAMESADAVGTLIFAAKQDGLTVSTNFPLGE